MVSIVIPVYNTAEYLHEALDSVMAQTFVNWECICVDDGSTDGSLDILQHYAARDARFRIVSQPNAGQSVARNRGLSMARGAWIYMMDSDDVLYPELLSETLDVAEKTAADVVCFNAKVIGDRAWCEYRMASHWPQSVMTGEELMRLSMQNGTYRCCVWLMLIARRALDGWHGKWFWPGIVHEDELFTAVLLAGCNRVAAVGADFVKHRVRGGSTMRCGFGLRNVDCYIVVCRELESDGREVLSAMAYYIMAAIFRTAASLPYRQRLSAFWRMKRSGWLSHVPLKVLCRFFIPFA